MGNNQGQGREENETCSGLMLSVERRWKKETRNVKESWIQKPELELRDTEDIE